MITISVKLRISSKVEKIMNDLVLANIANDKNSLMIIYVLYSALIVYFLYKFYMGTRLRKHIKGEQYAYGRYFSRWIYALCSMIFVFGVTNIVTADKISGILMIVLMLLLLLSFTDKTVVSESGIYGQGVFIFWDTLKKWGFDSRRSELVLNYKINGSEKQAFMKVHAKDIEDINAKIKQFKLKKKPKK